MYNRTTEGGDTPRIESFASVGPIYARTGSKAARTANLRTVNETAVTGSFGGACHDLLLPILGKRDAINIE